MDKPKFLSHCTYTGTVVYRGMLDGRPVAVKRMLRVFHAAADREMRLLIESDGHPNVVRYFLREQAGDFVYLVRCFSADARTTIYTHKYAPSHHYNHFTHHSSDS